MNTQLRTKATNEFEKDFYKLCNNSVYAKVMLENIEILDQLKAIKKEIYQHLNLIIIVPNAFQKIY